MGAEKTNRSPEREDENQVLHGAVDKASSFNERLDGIKFRRERVSEKQKGIIREYIELGNKIDELGELQRQLSTDDNGNYISFSDLTIGERRLSLDIERQIETSYRKGMMKLKTLDNNTLKSLLDALDAERKSSFDINWRMDKLYAEAVFRLEDTSDAFFKRFKDIETGLNETREAALLARSLDKPEALAIVVEGLRTFPRSDMGAAYVGVSQSSTAAMNVVEMIVANLSRLQPPKTALSAMARVLSDFVPSDYKNQRTWRRKEGEKTGLIIYAHYDSVKKLLKIAEQP